MQFKMSSYMGCMASFFFFLSQTCPRIEILPPSQRSCWISELFICITTDPIKCIYKVTDWTYLCTRWLHVVVQAEIKPCAFRRTATSWSIRLNDMDCISLRPDSYDQISARLTSLNVYRIPKKVGPPYFGPSSCLKTSRLPNRPHQVGPTLTDNLCHAQGT